MTRNVLSQDDVVRLLTNPSGEARAATAAKIAAGFGKDELAPGERKIAEEIFRLMVRDAEVRVREALAENLKHARDMPHEVAMALAKDVDRVAEPILKFSEVLTDGDLIEIIRTQGPAKQTAIAGRSAVSEAVSASLIETHNEAVVQTLVANEGAAISEKSLQQMVDEFGGREGVQAAMVHRPKLPVTVAERLVTLVSEKLKTELMSRHELPAALATDLLLQSRERAVIGISSEAEEQEVLTLVRQMRTHGRLTPSIVLRAAVMGDITFLEAALAELAGIPPRQCPCPDPRRRQTRTSLAVRQGPIAGVVFSGHSRRLGRVPRNQLRRRRTRPRTLQAAHDRAGADPVRRPRRGDGSRRSRLPAQEDERAAGPVGELGLNALRPRPIPPGATISGSRFRDFRRTKRQTC